MNQKQILQTIFKKIIVRFFSSIKRVSPGSIVFPNNIHNYDSDFFLKCMLHLSAGKDGIQLLESPIPTTTPVTPATTTSQKASSGEISGTKRGIIDPLV